MGEKVPGSPEGIERRKEDWEKRSARLISWVKDKLLSAFSWSEEKKLKKKAKQLLEFIAVNGRRLRDNEDNEKRKELQDYYLKDYITVPDIEKALILYAGSQVESCLSFFQEESYKNLEEHYVEAFFLYYHYYPDELGKVPMSIRTQYGNVYEMYTRKNQTPWSILHKWVDVVLSSIKYD